MRGCRKGNDGMFKVYLQIFLLVALCVLCTIGQAMLRERIVERAVKKAAQSVVEQYVTETSGDLP